jgi:hypothetical protein
MACSTNRRWWLKSFLITLNVLLQEEASVVRTEDKSGVFSLVFMCVKHC